VDAGARAAARPNPDLVTDFTELYREESAYVWHTLRRLGAPPRDLPDITQNVFVVVFRNLDRYDPSRPRRPWLFGIAFRVLSDHQKLARNTRESFGQDLELADEAPRADDLLSAQQRREIVHAALMSLDLQQRAVLVAHDFDETPGAQVAEALDITLKTFYYRLQTARQRFTAAVRRAELQGRSP
jgi:RNA polymerase sigma-70 factor, ECF subfamily